MSEKIRLQNCMFEVKNIEQTTETQFNEERHQTIFRAMKDVYERENGFVDLLLLRDELQDRGELESIGGAEYLVEIINEDA